MPANYYQNITIQLHNLCLTQTLKIISRNKLIFLNNNLIKTHKIHSLSLGTLVLTSKKGCTISPGKKKQNYIYCDYMLNAIVLRSISSNVKATSANHNVIILQESAYELQCKSSAFELPTAVNVGICSSVIFMYLTNGSLLAIATVDKDIILNTMYHFTIY